MKMVLYLQMFYAIFQLHTHVKFATLDINIAYFFSIIYFLVIVFTK